MRVFVSRHYHYTPGIDGASWISEATGFHRENGWRLSDCLEAGTRDRHLASQNSFDRAIGVASGSFPERRSTSTIRGRLSHTLLVSARFGHTLRVGWVEESVIDVDYRLDAQRENVIDLR